MKEEIAIRIKGVTKTYSIGVKKSDSFRNSFGELFSKKTIKPTFNALDNIDLELKKGEVLGVIGKNGAGKSTLLKVLSKITKPSKGRIEINGRVASLLEVGTGFHPELTGRENIYLNGTILGMTRKEVAYKLDEIIAFSGVEKFIDTPVKHYSSGMYVRLAFSVAAHLEPEILIIDEVLAVGDAEFQKKCLGKMEDVASEGRTVIFVSHNMSIIKSLCTKIIVLQDGKIAFNGKTSDGVYYYLNDYQVKNNIFTQNRIDKQKPVQFSKVEALPLKEEEGNSLELKIQLKTVEPFPDSFLAVYIKAEDGTPISETIPEYKPFIKFDDFQNSEQSIKLKINLAKFIPGNYKLDIWIGPSHNHTIDWQKDILQFEIINSPEKNRTVSYPKHAGFLVSESTYKIEKK